VPKAVAVGVVDMETGMMLDLKTTSSHPKEVFDFLAAATKDMFEGENVDAIEKVFMKARGVQTEGKYLNEFVVFSSNLLHYFARIPSNRKIVYGVVCSGDTNVGLLLVKAREIVKQIEV